MTNDTKPPPAPQTCGLFKLAAELRNDIYRLALISSEDIAVLSPAFTLPGILQTCSQTRSEALKLYYCENTFRIDTHKFEATQMLKWREHLEALGLEKDGIRFFGNTDLREPHWANLKAWLRIYHRRDFNAIREPGKSLQLGDVAGMNLLVIGGMFVVVKAMRGLEWEVVEEVVEKQRPVLGRLSNKWMKDY